MSDWTEELRAEKMRAFPTIQCPDWCTRQVDEGDHEQHLSEWVTVLDGTEDGDKITILARARRDWWNGQGPETAMHSWVELALHGNVQPSRYESDPPIKDAVAHLFLSANDLVALWDACEPLRAMAEMDGHDWDWAYGGAEDDADDEEEEADA